MIDMRELFMWLTYRYKQFLGTKPDKSLDALMGKLKECDDPILAYYKDGDIICIYNSTDKAEKPYELNAFLLSTLKAVSHALEGVLSRATTANALSIHTKKLSIYVKVNGCDNQEENSESNITINTK